MRHQDLLAWQSAVVYAAATNPNAWVLFVPQDPRRVALIMGGGITNQTMFVTTDPSQDLSTGIQISGNGTFQNALVPLVLNHQQHGALVQVAWYGIAQSARTLTAIGLIMELDPCDYRGGNNVKRLRSGLLVPTGYEQNGSGSDNFNSPLQCQRIPQGADSAADFAERVLFGVR